VATFFAGTVNPAFFGYTDEQDLPATILTTDCTHTSYCPFSSFSLYYRNGTTGRAVYKAFSSTPLTDSLLHSLFIEVGEVRVYDWLAYPVFHDHETLDECWLEMAGGGGVWYTAGFEQGVSCMECAAVSAKNVALLVAKAIDERVEEWKRRGEGDGTNEGGEVGRDAGNVDTRKRPVHLDL
jgi:hypothetical protein